MSLPYVSLKEHSNRNFGKGCHFFFKNWHKTENIKDVSIYRYILDTRTNIAYSHPMIKKANITRPATCYFHGKTSIEFSHIQRIIVNCHYIHANTSDGSYLLIFKDEVKDVHKICAMAYKTLVSDSIAVASRPVEVSDRQIHWVWFRRPNYRLTEEIVLRAASWIDLNPGYKFHLWSSLQDEEECNDFLKDLSSDIRNKYFTSGCITIHYNNEFHRAIFTWLSEHKPSLIDVFQQVWDSKERQDTVMKTDYTRNILLAMYGGIYTDFNDLLCLAPIEPLLEAHAGRYIGVTDNTSPNNASNYFMYAAKGSTEWLDITKKCTNTMQVIRDAIYSPESLNTAKQTIQDMLDGRMPNFKNIEQCIKSGLDRHYEPKHFLYTICLAIKTALPNTNIESAMNILLLKSAHGKMKASFLLDVSNIIQSHSSDIRKICESSIFESMWRFALTDMYLSSIMHRTNLPIFCREQNIPIFLVPFGYLLRYSCVLSYVGHLGDATSYGMDAQKKTTMKELLS